MKFIHAADIHLDSPLRGLLRYEGSPLVQNQTATRRAFVNLVELACQEKVDFILLAGDLYDGDWKDYNTGLFFNQQMAKLKDHAIKVFIVHGNHDAINVITKQLNLPDNVIKFRHEQAQTHILEHLGVAIHGQSFAARAVNENLAAKYPTKIPDLYNIGLLHTSLDGREGHDNYAPAQMADLLAKDYDYWALGHVHKHEVVHEFPHIIFAGNLQGRHARETGAKTCTLVTVDEQQTNITQFTQHSVDVLRWEICRIIVDDIKQIDDLLDAVQQAVLNSLASAQSRTLALRFNIEGKSPIHSELHRNSERWLQEIRSIATGVGMGNVWVEKVKITTQLPNSKQVNHTVLDELLRTIHTLPEDPEMLDTLSTELAQICRSLPHEIKTNRDILAELADVENILLARLLANN